MDDEPAAVVRETFLSRKPAAGSGMAAAASLAVILGISLVYWVDASGYARKLPASWESAIGRGEYWRLFTTLCVHADLPHLLSNSLALGVLSYLLYGYFGPLVYPVLTIGLSGIVTLVSLATYPPDTDLLGASGMIYLMASFWLTLYLLLDRRLSLGKRIMRITGFTLVVLIPTALKPLVSYRTHALGFASGVVFAVCYFLVRRREFRAAERIEWE